MSTVQVNLICTATDTDKEELEEIVAELQNDLNSIDSVQSSLIESKDFDERTKGNGQQIGALLLQILQTSGITTMIGVIGTWLQRDKRRSIEITVGDNSIKLNDITQKQQDELIEWFQIQTGMKFN